MEQVFAGRNAAGKILCIFKQENRSLRFLESSIGEFSSLAEVAQHPDIATIEVARPANESVNIPDLQIVENVFLTRPEHLLFSFLKDRIGVVIERETLRAIINVFGEKRVETLTVIIHRLRKKLECAGYKIRSVRGVGYILEKD